MLYADDACIVSRSTRGLGRMMAVFVEVFGAFGLTISESKTETMCMPIPRAPATKIPVVFNATGQQYRQTTSFTYLGGTVTERFFGCMGASRGGYRMARGRHYAKLSLSNAARLSSLTCVFCYFVIPVPISLSFVCLCFSLLSLELGRCSSDLFLSSRPRTGLTTTCITGDG